MEFKACATEIKADLASGEFEGYASTFGNTDGGYDIVMPGAFTRTLQSAACRASNYLSRQGPGL